MGCYEDFEVGDDFVLWGNNMAEMHPVLFSRILANKRENPGRPHRRHRHAPHADDRLRRHVRRVHPGQRPRAGQRHPPPARAEREDQPGLRARERRLQARHRGPEPDRLRLLGTGRPGARPFRWTGRALPVRRPGARLVPGRAGDVPRRLHAGAGERDLGRAGGADPRAGRHLRRSRPRHGQPLVHGREPAHARHLDEQPDHRPPPDHRQDQSPGLEPVQPHRPAVGVRHRARGRHAVPPAAGRHGRDESGAPRQGRGDLGRAAGHDQPQAGPTTRWTCSAPSCAAT